MLACKECIESLRPDDPRIRSGRYQLCGCDYCNKSFCYRELEEENGEELSNKQVESIAYLKLRNDLNCTKAEQNYLFNKINSHIDASKKRVDKENYEPF